MDLDIIKCHGSGNDFALVDARESAFDDAAWAAAARALSDRGGPVGSDGLLALTGAGGFGFRMWNPDGSEAATCLNGLRCVARLGFERLGVEQATVQLRSSRAEVRRVGEIGPGVQTVETRAGPASVDPGDVGLRVSLPMIEAVIPGLPSDRPFTAVAMPNPHLIAFVDRIDEGELVALGSWCEARPALLADRANVSFVETRDGGLFVRTFERGAGLTNACGSAMAAATFAAGLTGRVAFGTEITVWNAGGRVRASAEAPVDGGLVTIAGNATFEWDARVAIDVAGGVVEALEVTRERADEVRAWEAVRTNTVIST